MTSSTVDYWNREKWMTAGEVAEHLNITRQAVQGLVDRGTLVRHKTPYDFHVFAREDIEAYKALKAERDSQRPTEIAADLVLNWPPADDDSERRASDGGEGE